MVTMCQRPKRALSISTLASIGWMPKKLWCQRPKRALSISTEEMLLVTLGKRCQRPKRALSISTPRIKIKGKKWIKRCQRPKRALSISTKNSGNDASIWLWCVNALNGLFPFLRCPPASLINSGFPATFLQVFDWIFRYFPFFHHFLACS